MIIVSVAGPGMKEALAQIAGSSRYADLFELRLDLIQEPPLGMLMAAAKKPIIATCRPTWQGGNFRGSEAERMQILDAASELGARYIDLELGTDTAILRERLNRKQRVIVSYHHDGAGRLDLPNLYKRMRSTGADVLKLAFDADDCADIRHAVEFLRLARRDKQKAVAIAMGEFGEASRILYKKFGGWASYASPEVGMNSAPGQIAASRLRLLYRAENISQRTRVFGVVGNPLLQSKGIYLHNPLFQKAGMNAVYCRFQVKNVRAFMKHVAPMLSGFSVTIPHKQTIVKYLDQLDPTAKAIGAINTVVRRNGKLVGLNTDAPGALDAIENVVETKGKRMLIVGAGGAARAIAYEAKRRGASVVLTNRTEAAAKKLAKEFGVSFVARSEILCAARTMPRYDIIVNATSVGMTPHVNESPLPKSVLRNAVVFDAVYNPPITKLLRDAKSVGGTCVQGTEMYLAQAALQCTLYSGVTPKIGTLRKILA